jgi:hypothetical protein
VARRGFLAWRERLGATLRQPALVAARLDHYRN